MNYRANCIRVKFCPTPIFIERKKLIITNLCVILIPFGIKHHLLSPVLFYTGTQTLPLHQLYISVSYKKNLSNKKVPLLMVVALLVCSLHTYLLHYFGETRNIPFHTYIFSVSHHIKICKWVIIV